MTTSSFTETRTPPSFEEGKMYISNETEGLIVLCVFPEKGVEIFEGIVIHQGKSKLPIGRYVNSFRKSCFTDFHGEVVLKS